MRAQPDSDRGAVPLRAFCFYNLGGVLKRSDDQGVDRKLIPVSQPVERQFAKWLSDVDRQYTIDQKTVQTILDHLKSGQFKVADFARILHDSRLTWASSLDTAERELSVTEGGDFVKGVENELKISSAPAQPAADLAEKKPSGGSEIHGGDRSPSAASDNFFNIVHLFLVQLINARLDSGFDYLAELLYVVIAFLVAITVLCALTFLAVHREHSSKPVQTSLEVSQPDQALLQILEKYKPLPAPSGRQNQFRAVVRGVIGGHTKGGKVDGQDIAQRYQDLYSAIAAFQAELKPAALDSQLRYEGKLAEGLLGKTEALSGLVQESRDSIRRIVGGSEELSLTEGIRRIEESLNAIAQKYDAPEVQEGEAPNSLATIVRRWDLLTNSLAGLCAQIEMRASRLDSGSQQRGKTWQECLKANLDTIDLCLSDYLAALQELSVAKLDLAKAVDPLGKIVLDLREQFRDQALTGASAREKLATLWTKLASSVPMHAHLDPLSDLNELIRQKGEAEGELATKRVALDAIDRALARCRRTNETSAQSVERLVKDQTDVGILLNDVGGPEPELTQKAAFVSSAIAEAEKAIRAVAPDSNGAFGARVSRLAASYKTLRESQDTQVTLVEELCRWVNLNGGNLKDPDHLRALLGAVQLEETGPQRQLRLGLSSALITGTEEIRQLCVSGREDVVIALKLREIQKALPPILGLLQNRPPDRLLEECLAEGFAKGGFHWLFRAETLLNTYFLGLEEFDEVREWMGFTGAIVRATLRRLGSEVQMIPLLKPVQSLPSEGLEHRVGASPELRRVKEIWSQVHSLLDRDELADVAVDVQFFLCREKGQLKGTCRVITLNPSEWRTFEGAAS